jgi:hypothetical protein
VASLIKELRRSATARGRSTSVNFVTASPPQIGRVIREKLLLDGIEIDEIRFKNQMRHLVRGNFDALREHIGFKLSELLQSARAGRRDGVEYLFGDDWESDALIYSLYADALERRMDWSTLEDFLEKAGVHEGRYRVAIREALAAPGPRRRVRAIGILRARPRSAAEFEPFGRRLLWFDNYLECAFVLHALGELEARGIAEVALSSGSDEAAVAAAFEAVATRWPWLGREHLSCARRELVGTGVMAPVAPGSPWRRLRTRWRVARGLSPAPFEEQQLPMLDYDGLVASWSHRARKEKEVSVETE